MNPALAFPNPSFLQRGLNSLAVNAPIGLIIVAGIAAVYTLVNHRSEADRRAAFLKALLGNPDVTNEMFAIFEAAADPLDMAKRFMAENKADTRHPIRAAYAAAF